MEKIKNIGFLPAYKPKLKNKVFSNKGDNDLHQPFIFLKEDLYNSGIKLNTIDYYKDCNEIELLIVSRYEMNLKILFKLIKENPKIKILHLSTEEISIAPTQSKEFLSCGLFDRVLVWRDNEIDDNLFFKYYYMTSSRIYNQNNKSRNLLCMINKYQPNRFRSKHNIYNERTKIVEFFRNNSKFHLYGYNWSEYDLSLKNYKGVTKSKIETYLKYDFSFVFENSNNEFGGITEKIWDSLATGCIPIYYGVPNVDKYIPKKCFIDYREFENLGDLYNYLKKMTLKEKNEIRKTIKMFLNSNSYKKFTPEGFSKTMKRNINEMEKIKVIPKNLFKIKFYLIKKIFKYKISIMKNKRFFINLFVSKYF